MALWLMNPTPDGLKAATWAEVRLENASLPAELKQLVDILLKASAGMAPQQAAVKPEHAS